MTNGRQLSLTLQHSPTYLSNLHGRQVTPHIPDVSSHSWIETEPCALDQRLALPWFQIEWEDLRSECVGLNVAFWSRVEDNSFVLGGS